MCANAFTSNSLGGKNLSFLFSHSSWERLGCLQISYTYIPKGKYSPNGKWGRFWQLEFDLLNSISLVYCSSTPTPVVIQLLMIGKFEWRQDFVTGMKITASFTVRSKIISMFTGLTSVEIYPHCLQGVEFWHIKSSSFTLRIFFY